MEILNNILKKLKGFFEQIDKANRERYVEMAERELAEMENIFSLLTIGMVIGLPSPPVHISLELLPLMEREMNILFSRLDVAYDPLGELFSIFDID
jgi:hypothetical protein